MDGLRTKAAQVIFPRLGSNMPPPIRVHEDFDRFRRLHEKHQFGGLVLFNGHKTHTPETLAALQQISKQPLLVASDIERGAGQQIEGATLFPHAMACARAGEEAVTTFGRITAEEALASGIHIAFAPVTDVNSNPQNPIIGIRAFGTEPESVGRHVTAYIRACRSTGLLTTAKHFPGHGDTATDSHAELPVVHNPLSALEQTELAAFTSAIDAGAELIMTAHVVYPALGDDKNPATLSRPILTDLLREKMNFGGAIVSDSLIMKAIQPAEGPTPQYAADLLNAGLDILLDPIDPEAMLEAVIESVSIGLVSELRLDTAINRINALRSRMINRFGEGIFHTPPASLVETLGSEENAIQAEAIAAAAIHAQEQSAAFPSSDSHGDGAMTLFVTPYQTRLDPTQAPARAALLAQFPNLDYEALNADAPEAETERILQKALKARELLILIVSKPAAWHGYGLPQHLYEAVSTLTQKVTTTVVSLGDPNILDSYPNAFGKICTYSDVPASQRALVKYLAKRS